MFLGLVNLAYRYSLELLWRLDGQMVVHDWRYQMILCDAGSEKFLTWMVGQALLMTLEGR